MRIVPFRLALCVPVLLLAVACGEAPINDTPTFVGKIEGTDALIAVSAHRAALVAYTCGGSGSFTTHTGWYSGELVGAGTSSTATEDRLPLMPTGRLPTLQSAAGLTLDATIEGTKAHGTITLFDGSRRRFSAERARGTAGLYALQSDESTLVGLIVTNDGQMAGSARSTTAGGPPSSSPVTVTSPPAGAVTVAFPTPAGPSTGVRLQPLMPQRFVVTRFSPTLILFLHGMTPTSFFDGLVVNGSPTHDAPQWSRLNNDPAFVSGLLGDQLGSPGGRLHNLLNHDVDHDNFFTADIEPCEGSADAVCWAKHIMTLETPGAGPLPPARNVPPLPFRLPPRLSVFVGYRNGELGLVQQSKDAVKQLHSVLTWYEDQFNTEPRVIVLAHSFGGLVSRFILSNPVAQQLAAPNVNPDNLFFSASERGKADYIRDRTVYLITMGTPHQGSRFIDAVEPLRRDINAAATNQRTSEAAGRLIDLADNIPRLGSLVRLVDPLARATVNELLRQLGQVSTIGSIRDLTTSYWRDVNRDVLVPSQMVRSDLTPISGAGKKVIPLYSVGGRSPGGTIFDTVNLVQVATKYGALTKTLGRKRDEGWVQGTIFTDELVAATGGWGNSRTIAGGAFDAQLDRRRRLTGLDGLRLGAATIVDQLTPAFRWAFGRDVDAIVAFAKTVIYSGNANNSLSLPLYLATEPKMDLGGSVTIDNFPRIVCANSGAIIDLPAAFIEGMLVKYSSGPAAFNALASLNWDAVVAALRDLFDLALLVDVATCGPSLRFSSITVPAPRIIDGTRPASDDTVDSDGVVGYDSAMGILLQGTQAEPFDHRRNDTLAGGVLQAGPWYRLYDTPFNSFNHPMHVARSNGFWLNRNLLSAGPIAGPGDLSTWPASP